MSKIGFEAVISADGSTATITCRGADGSRAIGTLSAVEMVRMSQYFGNLRMKMAPDVTTDPGEQDIAFDLNYLWRVPLIRYKGRRLLVIRHRAYGWLGLALRDEDARALAKALVKPMSEDTASGRA